MPTPIRFEEKKFNLPELKGISKEQIDIHLKLYAGYVKHTNLILDKIAEMSADSEKNSYAIAETRRRLGFEFDGMRNHEYYFGALEGGAKPLPEVSLFKKAIEGQFGNFEEWRKGFAALAMTRGIGWAFLYFDPVSRGFVEAWVDEHQIGQLTGLRPIIALDMFEHAYMADYAPAEKAKYIEAYFENLNWEKIEEYYIGASK